MAGKHILDGLIKWSMRDRWADRFEEVLADHVLPACDETGLDMDEIVAMMGEDLFMSTVWACAFEDFLTREFDDGENAIDDYVKRRGWKETVSIRTYMAALRHSTMSLYEVSDVVPGISFRARDVMRGGEPVLISERSATRSLKPWDRIAARVLQVGAKTQIGGGMLVFNRENADDLIEAWHAHDKLGPDERRRLTKQILGDDLGDEEIAALSSADIGYASGSLFTAIWLTDVIERVREPKIPDLRNRDGEELIHCVVRYPLSKGTNSDEIRPVLQAHDEFCATGKTRWNWIAVEQMMAARDGAEIEQVDLTEEEMHGLVHDQMDRHYRSVLDEPVGSLGGLTPRGAVKTKDGRAKIVEWLKLLENMTAKSGDGDGAMASYSFGWEELGLK